VDEKVLINLLVEIADLEEELAAARHTLAHHSSREKDLRELQAEYEDDADRAQLGDQDVNVSLRGKENEIRAAEASLISKKDQIIGITDRRQHQAMLREIGSLEQKLVRLEDEAMGLLEAVEAAAEVRNETEAERRVQKDRGQTEIDRMDGETGQAAAAQAELEADMDRLLAMLPEAVKRHVQRLRQKNGRSVVHVQNGACGGCFGQLPAQQALDADKGRVLVRCAGCACYVVHRAWL